MNSYFIKIIFFLIECYMIEQNTFFKDDLSGESNTCGFVNLSSKSRIHIDQQPNYQYPSKIINKDSAESNRNNLLYNSYQNDSTTKNFKFDVSGYLSNKRKFKGKDNKKDYALNSEKLSENTECSKINDLNQYDIYNPERKKKYSSEQQKKIFSEENSLKSNREFRFISKSNMFSNEKNHESHIKYDSAQKTKFINENSKIISEYEDKDATNNSKYISDDVSSNNYSIFNFLRNKLYQFPKSKCLNNQNEEFILNNDLNSSQGLLSDTKNNNRHKLAFEKPNCVYSIKNCLGNENKNIFFPPQIKNPKQCIDNSFLPSCKKTVLYPVETIQMSCGPMPPISVITETHIKTITTTKKVIIASITETVTKVNSDSESDRTETEEVTCTHTYTPSIPTKTITNILTRFSHSFLPQITKSVEITVTKFETIVPDPTTITNNLTTVKKTTLSAFTQTTTFIVTSTETIQRPPITVTDIATVSTKLLSTKTITSYITTLIFTDTLTTTTTIIDVKTTETESTTLTFTFSIIPPIRTIINTIEVTESTTFIRPDETATVTTTIQP